MSSKEDQILRASKEIVVKFIETGRVSHTTFPEVFDTIYNAVKNTVGELEKNISGEKGKS